MRRIAAKIRAFLCGGRAKDEEYVSFRADAGGIAGAEFIGDGSGGRRGSDSDGDSSNGSDGGGRRKRRAPPPKLITFVSSRATPLGSPGEFATKESPAGFSVVDLRTPARSTHRGRYL